MIRQRLTNLVYDLEFILSQKPKVQYLGWLGYGNLGDEAIYSAVRSLFPSALFYGRAYVSKLVRLRRRSCFDAAMLGGGTLINHLPNYLDGFSNATSRFRLVFGTGVADPEFTDAQGIPYATRAGWTKCLRLVPYIGVRGPHSLRILKSWGIEDNAYIVGDPALHFASAHTEAPASKVLGVNVGLTQNRLWGGNDAALISIIVSELRTLARRGWRFVFFPVIWSDVSAIRLVAESLPAERCTILPVGLDVNGYCNAVRPVTVFLGEKLHAVVLAVCCGVPAVMLEYHPKCRDFMASIDRERYTIRTDHLRANMVVDSVESLAGAGMRGRDHWLMAAQHYRARLQQQAKWVTDNWLNPDSANHFEGGR